MPAANSFTIPLASGIDTYSPRHMLGDDKTPWAMNCDLSIPGMVRKRPGISLVHTFDDKILGYARPTANFSIIPTAGQKFFEWNNVPDPDAVSPAFAMTEITNAAFTGFSTSAPWTFTQYFDSNISGTSNQGEVLGWNGTDAGIRYDPNASSSDITLRTVGAHSSKITGKIGIPYGGNLFLVNTKDLISGDTFRFRVQHSFADNGLDFENDKFETRPEGGDQIRSIISLDDIMYVFKEESIWALEHPLSMRPITYRYGLTTDAGIAKSDTIYFNHNRKIVTLNDVIQKSPTWLSLPVHSLLAATNPGSGDMVLEGDRHLEIMRVSTGRRIFNYDKKLQGWSMWQYPEDVTILSTINPNDKDITGYIGKFSEHTIFTVAEEDIMPDMIMAYGDDGDKLVQQNHFAYDDLGGKRAIRMEYDTRYDAMQRPDILKRFINVKIQASPSSTWRLYTTVADRPETRGLDWTNAGDFTTDSSGFGWVNIDRLGVWISLRLRSETQEAAELYNIQVDYVEREEIV